METVILHSCCAPCSAAVLEWMLAHDIRPVVFYFNPNIFPQAEYEKRKNELTAHCQKLGVEVVDGDWDHNAWLDAVKGLENEPERGKRCSICFYMRLKRVMEYAKEKGYGAVASVLGVSRYKNLAQVNQAAQKASAETGVPYLEIEGRKGGMQERRQNLIKELNLYSQDYCGCKPRA